MDLLNIGAVTEGMLAGRRYTRRAWDNQGVFIFLVNGSNFVVNREPLLSILGEGEQVTYRPHIDVRDADGAISPWTASDDDLLAHDWHEVI